MADESASKGSAVPYGNGAAVYMAFAYLVLKVSISTWPTALFEGFVIYCIVWGRLWLSSYLCSVSLATVSTHSYATTIVLSISTSPKSTIHCVQATLCGYFYNRSSYLCYSFCRSNQEDGYVTPSGDGNVKRGIKHMQCWVTSGCKSHRL